MAAHSGTHAGDDEGRDARRRRRGGERIEREASRLEVPQ